MFGKLKKVISIAVLTAMITNSVSAFSGTPVTQFDYILQQIEKTSLFTQNKEMSEEERKQRNEYIEQNPDKLQQVVNDYLQTLDSHSMFLTENEYKKGFSTLVKSVGIGVDLQKLNGENVIISVEENSPAEKAGLKFGDAILKIDGVFVENKDINYVLQLLSGEIGTQVRVSINREGQITDYTFTREHVQRNYLSNYTVEDGIEYIRIEAMGSENDYKKFEIIWNGLDEKNTKAVILDLRSNGGGLVDIAWKMADLIMEKENVYMGSIQWREDDGGTEEHYSKGKGLPLNKICILVDENTASAAELLAGVLKEAGKAEVVGTTTYGKGQGQYHFDVLGGKYKLIITCMQMNLPISGCWEGVGIAPTVETKNKNVIETAVSQLPKIDYNSTIRYGEQSKQVEAISGRLYLLGYMNNIQDRFDTTMLEAVRKFQSDEGLPLGVVAGVQTFEKLEAKISTKDTENVNENDVTGDEIFDMALEICRKAAKQPLRYVSQSDGTFIAA